MGRLDEKEELVVVELKLLLLEVILATNRQDNLVVLKEVVVVFLLGVGREEGNQAGAEAGVAVEGDRLAGG